MKIKKVVLILSIILLSVTSLQQFSDVSQSMFENLKNESTTILIPKVITRISQSIPSEPQFLSASVGAGRVDLSWTAPSSDGGANITGYNVYRATTSGGPYTLQNTSIYSIYTDLTVTNNMTYYYVVTAVNSVGESDYSFELRVTLPTTPSAPRSLQATTSEYAVTLSWTAPSYNFYASITGYNVYRSTTSGGPYTWRALNLDSLSFSEEPEKNDVTYYYVVTAVNEVGESVYSNEVNANLTPTTTGSSPGFGIIVILMGITIGISIKRKMK